MGSTALSDVPVPEAADDPRSRRPPRRAGAGEGRADSHRWNLGRVVITALVLIFLLIFIRQHLTGVRVFFLGAAGTLPLGVAMLFAAIAEALLVALIGSARILQFRHTARRR
jgi:uncharacterized integral membrane protein